MRMPDRLAFEIDVPAELQGERFPAMALLTLVENAIRHGIDPSEQGGRIVVRAHRPMTARCRQRGRQRRWPARRRCAGHRADQPARAVGDVLRRRRAAGAGRERRRAAWWPPALPGREDAMSSSALIADDEPLLRERLRTLLARPAGAAGGGRGAQRPRGGGARRAGARWCSRRPHAGPERHRGGAAIARRAQLVFVTACEQYALQAFEQGAPRLPGQALRRRAPADTVQRLRERLRTPRCRRRAWRPCSRPLGRTAAQRRLARRRAICSGSRPRWARA